jgi:hypothetical protein
MTEGLTSGPGGPLDRLFDSAYPREVVSEVWSVPDLADLEGELRGVLKRGLPVTVRTAGRLQTLSGVLARSPRLDEAAVRVATLNRLLNEVVEQLPTEPELARGAPSLFGLAPGTSGLTLTARRAKAAEVLGYDPDHVRKHLETRILLAVAEALRMDTLRYRARVLYGGYDDVSRPAADGSPRIGPDDLVEREELSARIWSVIYLLRAEFIAVGRARRNDDGSHQFDQVAERALYAMALQLSLLDEYVTKYGERIMRGGLEHHVDYLVRIASWHPPFSASEATRLRLAIGLSGERPSAFKKRILSSPEGRRLVKKWRTWMAKGWPAEY